MPDFQIDSEETESGTTLKLSGELDGANAEAVIAQFDRAVAAGCQQITIDLNSVSFIDSAGLRAIIVAQRRAAELELSLIVIPPPEPLLDLLQITGLTERLALGSEDAAPSPEHRFLERVDLELRRDPQAPGHARGEVRQAVERRLTEVELATALLLTSELVTNAVVTMGSRSSCESAPTPIVSAWRCSIRGAVSIPARFQRARLRPGVAA